MFQHNGLQRGERGVLTIAMLAAITAVVLGASNRRPAEPPPRVVTIGGIFPLTGAGTSFGQKARAAMELAIEDVNRELGHNALGLRFAVRVEDGRFDPAVALGRARALRAAGIRLVIGPTSSAEVAALEPYVGANDMLLVSPSSTAGSLAIPGDNVFRFAPSDSLEAVAITTMMWDDSVRAIVPIWHDDPSGNDLVKAVRSRITGLGGAVLQGVRYGAAPDFETIAPALRAQVDEAIARSGREKVGVYYTGFEEVVGLFTAASTDPVLGSIPWYGSDAGVMPDQLLAAPTAARFASRVGYPNPIASLEEGTRDHWQPILERIQARTAIQTTGFDVYALAVYDAVWVAAKAYLTAGPTAGIADLKQAFTTAAATNIGATGWTVLNAAGDRKYGDFDFWAMRDVNGALRWTRIALYQTRTQKLVRFGERAGIVSSR